MKDRKPRLVIIDTDYDFLKTCEEDIIREFAAEAEVQEITDPGYVDAYFSEEQPIDVLLIDEDSYGDFLAAHTIRRTFLMVSEIGVGKQYPDNVTVLMKYMPKEEILKKIADALHSPIPDDEEAGGEEKEEKPARATKIIGVYSPIGGCGKSLVCVALARKLKKLDQKVLLIGCDPTQSISVYYPEKAHASGDLAEKLKNPDDDTYWTILQNIGQDEVSYVLPFEKSLTTMGIGSAELEVLVRTLADKKDFDVIILDLGSVMSREVSAFMDQADSLILVTEANGIANRKMQKLLADSDLLPKCNSIVVANEYRSDGMHFSRDTVFGTIAPYPTWREALEDPVFYRIALQIAG